MRSALYKLRCGLFVRHVQKEKDSFSLSKFNFTATICHIPWLPLDNVSRRKYMAYAENTFCSNNVITKINTKRKKIDDSESIYAAVNRYSKLNMLPLLFSCVWDYVYVSEHFRTSSWSFRNFRLAFICQGSKITMTFVWYK